MTKTLVATIDTFTKKGRYVPRGSVLSEDEIDLDEKSSNVTTVDGISENAVVEIAAVAPTGPNPVNPQQLSPTGEQTVSGYVDNGARLVGEVTKPEKERRVQIVEDDGTQAKIAEALDKARTENDDDALVAGTVADVTANIGDLDDDGLDQLEAAEKDREQPRKGVLSAIKAERASRSA